MLENTEVLISTSLVSPASLSLSHKLTYMFTFADIKITSVTFHSLKSCLALDSWNQATLLMSLLCIFAPHKVLALVFCNKLREKFEKVTCKLALLSAESSYSMQ